MFFQECERIANKYPDLRNIIVKIDELLYDCGHSSVFRPDEIASKLRERESRVLAVFDLLTKQGLLLNVEYIECPDCETLLDVKDYEQAVKQEDPFECTQCQRDLSVISPAKTIRYRLNSAIKNVRKSQAAKQSKKTYATKDKHPTKEIEQIRVRSKGKRWDAIEITFTKQNKVLIYINGKNPFPRSITYKQLNLDDKKGHDKFIEEWNILRELAGDPTGAPFLLRSKDNHMLLARYVSNLRTILKHIFQIKDNPISYKKRNKPYQFKFTLST
jgi:hypothetical protein